MRGLRSSLAALGVALAALGLLFVLVPEAARVLPLSRVGLLFLGLFAVLQAVRSLRTRWRTPVDGAELPEPERRHETDRPGDDFDEQVAALARGRGRPWTGGGSERLRRRLRAAAVEAAAHRWRLPHDEARERVDAGEWTDDLAAAWFLGDSEVEAPPWPVRIRAQLGPGAAVGYYASRTADAVVSVREAP